GILDFEGDVVWSAWGSTDPNAAAAMARRLPNIEGERDTALKKIAEALARRDPAAALAFAKTQAPELLKDDSLGDAIGQGASTQRPEDAARQLASLGQTTKLDDAAARWGKKDRPGALAWARGLEAGPARTKALEG